MGITWHEAKALVEIYKRHGPFGKTATLGRQFLYLNVGSLKRMFEDVGAVPQGSLGEFLARPSPLGEDFLRLLGASEIVSFDYSDFEGANVCHDMNLPLPVTYCNAFDVVYDGGTLEHIFNFPQAIRNCMMMPKESGLFLTATPANNWMGHGFYQFSPELFFRLFSEENGFHLERMIAAEYWEGGSRFEVEDPKKLGKRVELWGAGERISLLVIARKTRAIGNDWTAIPQQSDYAAIWSGSPEHDTGLAQSRGVRSCPAAFLKEHIPQSVKAYRWFRDLSFRLGVSVQAICPGLTLKVRLFGASRRYRREMTRRKLRFNNEAFKKID